MTLITKLLISFGTSGTVIFGFGGLLRVYKGEPVESYAFAPIFIVILLVGIY